MISVADLRHGEHQLGALPLFTALVYNIHMTEESNGSSGQQSTDEGQSGQQAGTEQPGSEAQEQGQGGLPPGTPPPTAHDLITSDWTGAAPQQQKPTNTQIKATEKPSQEQERK